jgi:hypothetical protein
VPTESWLADLRIVDRADPGGHCLGKASASSGFIDGVVSFTPEATRGGGRWVVVDGLEYWQLAAGVASHM